MLDCQLFGLQPAGHHFTNVLLHAVVAILLFLALRRMTGALWPAAFAAAIFAIHPLRVESVAWVTERKDVLSGLFFMLTLLAYERYARQPWSLARYMAVVLLFAVASVWGVISYRAHHTPRWLASYYSGKSPNGEPVLTTELPAA